MESGTYLLFTTNLIRLFLKFLRWQLTGNISKTTSIASSSWPIRHKNNSYTNSTTSAEFVPHSPMYLQDGKMQRLPLKVWVMRHCISLIFTRNSPNSLETTVLQNYIILDHVTLTNSICCTSRCFRCYHVIQNIYHCITYPCCSWNSLISPQFKCCQKILLELKKLVTSTIMPSLKFLLSLLNPLIFWNHR